MRQRAKRMHLIGLSHVEDIVTRETDHQGHTHSLDHTKIPANEPEETKHSCDIKNHRQRSDERESPIANENNERKRSDYGGGN